MANIRNQRPRNDRNDRKPPARNGRRVATPVTATPVAVDESQRLQKALASGGYGSRRQIEEWIREGRVTVNGAVATLGVSVRATDKITVDGKLVSRTRLAISKPRVIMYHKPGGEVCTRNDPEGRPTVFENLPKIGTGRWVSIGRLDFMTQGLLLFTTDGELANKLMHPSGEVEREYAVRVLGDVSLEMLERMRKGVTLDDGPAKFDAITQVGGEGANSWYHVTLKEGRNREVRRVWESQGVKVSRLTRVRFGSIGLPRGLRAGQWRELTDEEADSLRGI